jgi:hypothetical protein
LKALFLDAGRLISMVDRSISEGCALSVEADLENALF